MFNSTTITVCKAWVSMFDAINKNGLTVDDTLMRAALPHFVKLVDVAEGFQNTTNDSDDYIKAADLVMKDQAATIDNLRKDIDGLLREIDTLRAKNNNQAVMLHANRTTRKDFIA